MEACVPQLPAIALLWLCFFSAYGYIRFFENFYVCLRLCVVIRTVSTIAIRHDRTTDRV